MTKRIAEQAHAFSIFWLKKHGYFHKDYSSNFGSITWTSGWSENKSSISFSVSRKNWGTSEEKAQIDLSYTRTDYRTEEKSDMNYTVKLAITRCHYGGVRYWFICPLTENGRYCGKRVGVIYAVGKYFGCRRCANIAYDAQMRGGRFRYSVIIPDVERQQEKVKRYYYNGKPTRKYRRLMKMEAKLERDFTMMAARFGHI